ncbi:T9SS type A sorting domain-containing protein [Flavobacterium sp. UBA2787]|nr:T9SS type A sorting domain-containing protein [Flavobacterium sp. UBA2787]
MNKFLHIQFLIFIFFSNEIISQDYLIGGANQFKGYDLSIKHGIVSNLNGTNVMNQTIKENEVSSLLANNLTYDFHGKIGNSINIPRAQCSDSNGNIYITGSSGNESTKSGDITTIKVNSSGVIEWTLRIPSPEFTVNSGTAITIDSNGFLYLVGYLWNQTSMDVFCAKISNEGQLIWQIIYGNSSNFEIPNSLVLSNSGELYVSGITHSNSKVTYYISKVSSLGQLLWEHVDTTFPSQTWNEPKILRLDNLGNLLVCGYGYEDNEEGSASKTVTIKFNSAGVQLWKKYKSTQITIDNNLYFVDSWPTDFTLDTNNSIYVVKNYNDEFFTKSATIKYDHAGEELWLINQYFDDESSTLLKSILFHENKLFVGGYKNGNPDEGDGFVLHSLNLDGSSNWSQHSSDQYVPSDFFMSLISSTICLNSRFMDSDTFESVINSSTYSIANGSLQSSNEFYLNQASNGITVGAFLGVTFNSNSKSFILNSTYSTHGTVYEVLQFDAANSLIWNTKYVSQNSIRVNVLETVADSSSNTFSLISSFYVNEQDAEQISQKSYIIKYNSIGQFVSSYMISDTVGTSSLRLFVTNNNELVVLSKDFGSISTTLTKFTNNLEQVWSQNFSLNSMQNEIIVIDNLNNIFMITAVDSQNNFESSLINVIKFNSNGVQEFSNLYIPTNSALNFSFATSALFDGSNSILIGGVSSDDFSSIFYPIVLNISINGTQNYFNDYHLNDSFSSKIVELSINDNEIFMAVNGLNNQTFMHGNYIIKINNLGQLIWQIPNFMNDAELFMDKFLLSSNLNKLYIVSSKVGSIANIHIDCWDLLGNFQGSYDIDSNNYYQDAFLDNDSIYVLSQNQSSYNFPYRLLNWNGPFISSQISKFSSDLVLNETINFFGPEYSLFEPKQLIPLDNSNLLISGRLFHEELFFEGLKFFSIPYEPTLNIPEVPVSQKNIFYCFPNPSSHGHTNVYFSLEHPHNAKLSILDLNGRLVDSFDMNDLQEERNLINYNTQNLKHGVYILKLDSNDISLTTKLIIQ